MPEPSRWARLKGLFHTALELPLDRREGFLFDACAGDKGLLAEVRALLAAHEGAGEFLARDLLSLDPSLAEEVTSASVGLRIGSYRVLAELARGGMGAVYEAVRDDDTYEQKVAIKLIKRGMDTDEIVRRFVAERQILARLVHPNIARLLDGGTTSDGRPYFVMERIHGREITRYCHEEQLSVESRLRLFLIVAEAVHFAHQNLVVHRDLKPANVLVADDGTPKLLDFGIAKLLDASVPAETVIGAHPRTPEYASPEQLAGGVITTVTDVYGLGLLLYEILTGERAGSEPASRHILALAQSDSARNPEAQRLARRLRGDLDTILVKALAAEPAQRYASVRDFMEDLERHLERRPVRARRPTPLYRFGSFLRRYKLASAITAAILLLAITASLQAYEASRQRDRAERQSSRARALSDFLIDLFSVANPDRSRGDVVTARELLAAGKARLETDSATAPRWLLGSKAALDTDPETRADLLHAIGEVYQNLGLSEEARSALDRSLELREGLSGRSVELDRASTFVELAHLARARGERDRSRELYGRALEIRRRELGPHHLAVAEVLNGLGLLEAAEGKGVQAREALAAAIAIDRQAGEPGRLPLAEALSNLGGVEITEGNAEAAAEWLEEARQIHHALLGGDHPRTASDLSQLGGLLFSRGDYGGAAARFSEALELRRRMLGNQHPQVATVLSNLATVHVEQGALVEAEAELREALAIQRRVHTSPHANVAHTLNNLGSVLRELGRVSEAAVPLEEALRIYRQTLGEQHTMVATCLNNLALTRRDQGDTAAATRLSLEALAMRRQLFGDEHTLVATSLFTLGDLALLDGRLQEAEGLHRQSLEMLRKLLAADHPAIASSLVGLGTVLARSGRAAEALPLVAEGLARRRKSLPAEHLLVAQAEGTLGEIYLDLGRSAEARPLLIASHATLLRLRGSSHAETKLAAARLARLSAD